MLYTTEDSPSITGELLAYAVYGAKVEILIHPYIY